MRSLLVAVSLLVLVVPGSQAAAAPTRAETWRTLAARALATFKVAELPVETAHAYAFAAQASAWLDGWDSPDATTYLAKLLGTTNTDGGYGLGYAYDAFQDGTLNPADTTYTITLAQHVGPVLLDGWRAGVVPAGRVQQVVDLLATMPRLDTAAGRCLGYSRNPNDSKAGLCTHNASIAAAHFLLQAADAGFPGVWWLMAGIAKRELSVYNITTRWWPYRDTPMAPQDADHNSFSAEAAYALTYPVGYAAAYGLMVTDFTGNVQAPVAHMRLTGLPPVPSAMSVDEPGITIWCVLGDRWLTEANTFVTAQATNARRLAQAAYYAARNARACD